MKKNVFLFALAAALMMTSCAGKKELLNCQTENKSVSYTHLTLPTNREV